VIDAQGAGLSIKAGSLILQPKGVLQSLGGDIDATTTGAIQLQANADGSGRSKMDVSSNAAGTITLVAGGDLTVAGQPSPCRSPSRSTAARSTSPARTSRS
jgi:hypothetical protein